jgi:hypothetical protein
MWWLIGIVTYLSFGIYQAKVIGKRERVDVSLEGVFIASFFWFIYWFEMADTIIVFKADKDD